MSAPKALLLVRNTFTHDARVLRAAETLRARGFAPLVVAVVSTEVRLRSESKHGTPVLRLAPSSPLSWACQRLGRGPKATHGSTGGLFNGESSGSRHVTAPRGVIVRFHRFMRTLDFYRRAYGVVRRERPALVHCNDYNTMWVGMLTRMFMGAAVVYDAHEIWPDRNLRPEPRWWLLACEALFVRGAHVAVTASPGYATVMARRYRVHPPVVVRNIPPRRASPPAPPTVDLGLAVYAGALTPHRGLEEAISALARVEEVRLRLMGPGLPDYVERLFDLARREGCSDRLELHKQVPPAEVVAALAGAGIGLALFQPVCLSHRLVAPNKLFEYMVAGVPTLASDLPVIEAFVARHGVGMTVAATDVASIADAMCAMLEPERNRELRAATAIAAREVTWEAERAVLLGAYEHAVRAATPL